MFEKASPKRLTARYTSFLKTVKPTLVYSRPDSPRRRAPSESTSSLKLARERFAVPRVIMWRRTCEAPLVGRVSLREPAPTYTPTVAVGLSVFSVATRMPFERVVISISKL